VESVTEVVALAMTLALTPFAIIFITIHVDFNAMSMPLSLVVIPFVRRSVGSNFFTTSMRLQVQM
jgi:hypothetical protein